MAKYPQAGTEALDAFYVKHQEQKHSYYLD